LVHSLSDVAAHQLMVLSVPRWGVPASTVKIASSLIALETDVVRDAPRFAETVSGKSLMKIGTLACFLLAGALLITSLLVATSAERNRRGVPGHHCFHASGSSRCQQTCAEDALPKPLLPPQKGRREAEREPI